MKQICSQKVLVTAKYTVSKAIEIMHSAKRLNSQLFLSKDGITIQANHSS